MYLGLTDGGNSQSGDWNAISSHPNYGQFEALWLEDEGYADDRNTDPPYLLPQPLVIKGVSYNYVWLTSNGNLYFSEEGEDGDWYVDNGDYTPNPGEYGKPSLMPMVSDKICSFAGVRRSPTSLTFRFQAASYDLFDALDGVASVIWEITFYKPDPELDADLQFIQFQCSGFDPVRDANLVQGQVDWSNEFIFGGADNNQRLFSFEMPTQVVADTAISYVFSGDPNGDIWNFQADRYLDSPCDFIPQVATVAHGHAANAYNFVQTTIVAHGHATAAPITTFLRTFTYQRNNAAARQLPEDRLQGMWPMFMFAHESDRSSTYGAFLGTGTGQGFPIWKKYCDPTDELYFPDHTPGYYIARRYLFWQGGVETSLLNAPGVLFTNQSSGSDFRNIFFVFGGESQWKYRDESGMPYRFQKGRFMSVITIASNRDKDIYEPYTSRFDCGSLSYTELRWPQPATGQGVDPESGAYVWSREAMPAWKAAGNGYEQSAQLAQPMAHGLGQKPSWMIVYWGYWQSYARHGGYVVYFGDDSEPQTSFNGPAAKYMTSVWPRIANNNHLSNTHYLSNQQVSYVDSENIYLTTEVVTNQIDNHPRLDQGSETHREGLTYHIFADDQETCMTRYVPIGNRELNEIVDINVGWRPDVVFTWPYGEQGFSLTYKLLIISTQPGDERAGDIYAHDLTAQTVRRYTEPDAWVRDYYNRFEYQLHEGGVRFRRIAAWQSLPQPGSETDWKMFISLQRQAPSPNSNVGQFFLDGHAGFTYSESRGYAEHGEFVITGQELLKDDGVLPYPPPLLEKGEFELIGSEVTFTYIRKLFFELEAGEFEYQGQVAQLIFCCYPDLIADAGAFDLTGFAIDFSFVRRVIGDQGSFVLTGADAQLTYLRYLRLEAETGEFLLNGEETSGNRLFTLIGSVGEFTTTGFDAGLSIGNARIRAGVGEFLLTGGDGIALRDPLKADVGSFELTGGDADQQLGSYPFFEAEVGHFYLGGGFTDFRRDLRIFSVGYGSFNTFGQEAQLKPGYALTAEAGQFVLNGYAGLGPAMQAGTGEFVLTGVDADRNTPAYVLKGAVGAFLLEGQEVGGDVTQVVPLVCEAGSFVLTGSGTTGEQLFPGPFPIQTAQGHRVEYLSTGRGNQLAIDGLPHTPAWVMCLPTDFPLAARIENNQDPLFTYDEPDVQRPGFQPWTATRGLAGVNDTSSWTKDKLDGNQPALLASWLANGILYGAGDWFTWSSPGVTRGPRDRQNSAYNFVFDNSELLPEEWKNAPIKYMLLSLRLQHPDLEGDEPSDLILGEEANDVGPRTHKLPNYTGFDGGRDLPVWGRQVDEDYFNEAGDQASAITRDELDTKWVKWDTWEEAKAYHQAQLDEAGATFNVESRPDEPGVSWHYTDQLHGGIAIGAYIINGSRLNLKAPNYNFATSNILLQGIKHGLAERPDLLILQTTGGVFTSADTAYQGSAIWIRPGWKSADGVRTDIDRVAAPLRSFFDEPSFDLDTPQPHGFIEDCEFWDFWGDEYFRIPQGGEGGNATVDADPYKNISSKQWIALKNTPGHIMTGSYKNAGAGVLWVACTFRPAFVWIMATGGTGSGLYIHHRAGDITLDGQSNYTHQIGRLVYDSTTVTENEWGADGWKPSQKGGQSITFAKGGFYVPIGAIGNDASVPDQEVTFAAFAHEHWRIQRMAVQPGAFELQGQEIGSRRPDRIFALEAGEFMVCNTCEARLVVTRANDFVLRLKADSTIFQLRGLPAWSTELVLQAKVGAFELTGFADLRRTNRILFPVHGSFVLGGQEALLREYRLVAETGRFNCSLQWAGGSGDGCQESGGVGATAGSIPMEFGRDPTSSSMYNGTGWTVLRGAYQDDGYIEIDLPNGYAITINGETATTLYYSTNGYATIGTPSSTYSVRFTSPPYNKIMLQANDRSQLILATAEFADRFVIRSENGPNYSNRTAEMISELTLFPGLNVIQVNWGQQNSSNGYFCVASQSENLCPNNDRAFPDTTYVFEGNEDGTVWSRTDDAHVAIGTASSCLFAEAGVFACGGGATVWRFGPRQTLEPGEFVIRGGKTVAFYISKLQGVLQAYEGVFLLTGGEIGSSRALTMKAGTGAFLLNGWATSGLYEQVLRAESGSFALTGFEAGAVLTSSLEAEAGDFELGGEAAQFNYRRRLRLVSNVGSFLLEGQSTEFKRGRTFRAGVGSFVLNGRQAGTINEKIVRAWVGNFLLEGQDIGGKKTAIVLSAEVGAFAVIDGKTDLRYFRAFDPSLAQFLLTGFESEGLYSRRLVSGSGAFALGGNGATFTYVRQISFQAETGQFNVFGRASSYRQDQLINGGNGLFVITGQGAGLKRAQVLMSSGGQYFLNGQDAQFIFVRIVVMTGDVGSFGLGGQEARLRVLGNTKMQAGVGSFLLSGVDAEGRKRISLVAEAGSFQLNGEVAGSKQSYRLSAAAGSFEVNGEDVVSEFVRVLSAMAGSFQLIGRASGYIQDQLIGANNGVILLSGGEAQFTYYRNLKAQADVGAFVLTGEDSEGVFEEAANEYLSSWSRQNYGPLSDARVDGWAGSET